jgi:hypothetical protein
MSIESVVAVYSSFDDATRGIQALDDSGFPHRQVSLVSHQNEEQVPRNETKPGDESEHQAVKGAAFGGLLGMLAGAPLLAIPGVGPLLLAGPIATGMTGALVGGFLGSMSGWGVHADHVAEYQRKVEKGKVLVIASGNPRQIADAERILRETHPVELHLHAEDSADAEEIVST